jgi:hypothetical protein
MTKIALQSLAIEVAGRGDPVLVIWSGESDALDPSAVLRPHFDQMMEHMKAKNVHMKFDQLTYMNSATVRPIMELLDRLSTVAKHIRVEYRRDVTWQAASFRAMRIVAKKWNNVEIVGV